MNRFLFIISICILLLLIFFSFFPQVVTSYSPENADTNSVLLGISLEHPAGTDSLGRDLLARLFSATQVSLLISVTSAFLAICFGVFIGALAGLYAGQVDRVLMRFVDFLISLPDILVFVLLGLFLGRSPWGLIFAISLLTWTSAARLTRSACLTLRSSEFLIAAEALGVSFSRRLLTHVWPHLKELIVTAMLFKIPQILSIEATLSFMGLGLVPPQASFGSLAREGFSGFLFYPHLVIFPFLFIFLTVFSLYNVARGLQQSE